MGAVKKPEMTLRAIHCPLVLAYGLDSNMSGELFLPTSRIWNFLPPHSSTLR